MKEFSYESLVKDPAVFADGRLPAHSDHLVFRSAEDEDPRAAKKRERAIARIAKKRAGSAQAGG